MRIACLKRLSQTYGFDRDPVTAHVTMRFGFVHRVCEIRDVYV
jgi:hypothetical protein